MIKLIIKNKEIEFDEPTILPENLPNDTRDIKLVGDDYIDLCNLNLNIVKYELLNYGKPIHIRNCNINKLIFNNLGRDIRIFNSTINDIYIQSKIESLMFINANIPNLHDRVDLINKITIIQ